MRLLALPAREQLFLGEEIELSHRVEWRDVTGQQGVGFTRGYIVPNRCVTMLNHSASSASRHTELTLQEYREAYHAGVDVQLPTVSIVFSATDIASFLACPHTATLDRAESRNEITKPFFNDPALDLLRKLGREHEQRYLRELIEKDGLRSPRSVNGAWDERSRRRSGC